MDPVAIAPFRIIAGWVIVGVLALLIYLIANSKTRAFGLALAIAGLLSMSLIATWVSITPSYHDLRKEAHRVETDIQAQNTRDLAARYDELNRPRISLEADVLVAAPEPVPAVEVADGDQGTSARDEHSGTDAVPPSESIKAENAAEPAEEATEEEAPSDEPPPLADADAEVPDWVTNPPKRVGNVYQRVVKSGPYATLDECYRNLNPPILEATAQFMEQLLDVPFNEWQVGRAGVIPGVTPGYIRHAICRDEYVKTVETSVGTMKELYVKMEFDPTVQRELKSRWNAYVRRDNLASVGLISGLVLGCLVLTYSLLVVDTWTKGYYTKRLFLGVPLVIIGTVILVALIAEFG